MARSIDAVASAIRAIRFVVLLLLHTSAQAPASGSASDENSRSAAVVVAVVAAILVAAALVAAAVATVVAVVTGPAACTEAPVVVVDVGASVLSVDGTATARRRPIVATPSTMVAVRLSVWSRQFGSHNIAARHHQWSSPTTSNACSCADNIGNWGQCSDLLHSLGFSALAAPATLPVVIWLGSLGARTTFARLPTARRKP